MILVRSGAVCVSHAGFLPRHVLESYLGARGMITYANGKLLCLLGIICTCLNAGFLSLISTIWRKCICICLSGCQLLVQFAISLLCVLIKMMCLRWLKSFV
jgi:hypothetical protein